MNAVQRPLPLLTQENEFFWTSGKDGILRVQRSAACGALLFPPTPICPYCHSKDIEIVGTSGQATVVGVTINHHSWLPGFPPPYAVAIVALDDDSRVRLTTNIVRCDPESVRPGLRVEVDFEQHEDTWIPVFAPIVGEGPGTLPEEDPARYQVRPMLNPDKFEDKVAITGIGMSQIGRRLMREPLSLTVDACLEAVRDAGLRLSDIDGLSTYPAGAPAGGHSEGGITPVVNALGLQPTWISGGPDTPGQTGSIVNAMLAVAAGLCRHVLCFRTVWESTATELQRRQTTVPAVAGRVDGDMQWRLPYGASSAANWIAMYASLHMHRYGTPREALGWIAVTERKHAALNPAAIYRDPLTIDDYFNARIISTPFGPYDCDVPCDAATAIIVSAKEVAHDLAQPPVLIEAIGTQITERVSWDQGTLEHEPQLAGPSAHLWSRTELRPRDVDVALLYDGFTFNCLSWLEALGFCGHGEGGDFVAGGTRISLDGDLPLNPHGGQLSAGRTHGYGVMHEAVVQLREIAGARQVRDAKTVVLSTGGGTPGGCILLRKE